MYKKHHAQRLKNEHGAKNIVHITERKNSQYVSLTAYLIRRSRYYNNGSEFFCHKKEKY